MTSMQSRLKKQLFSRKEGFVTFLVSFASRLTKKKHIADISLPCHSLMQSCLSWASKNTTYRTFFPLRNKGCYFAFGEAFLRATIPESQKGHAVTASCLVKFTISVE
jgi:hypothetical protein